MASPLLLALLLTAAVRFPNSGAAAAQPAFLRGVEALHSFQYEDAVEAFREAQGNDRGFAMAYWGEAMACNQTLWLNQDADAARAALARLAPTPQARLALAPTEREKGYLRAIESLYGAGERAARDRAYAESMRGLAGAHPADLEARSFFALALMGTAARSPALLGDAGDDRHQHALVGSSVQREAAAILRSVLALRPDHPGALHYLIHDYDDPAHARLALPAARAYAKVAPGSSHALHMPAHIFVQLGMWHDAAAADQASFDASGRWVKRKALGIAMRDYHSLSWLLYESLQLGRFAMARSTLDTMQSAMSASGGPPRLKALFSDMRSRYVIEARAFDELAGARSFDTNGELFAIGMSAVARRDAGSTDIALAELERRAGSGGQRLDIAVMAHELGGLRAHANGRADEARALLAEAARLELQLPPPLGLPQPVKPAAELYAETLLALGQPRLAAAQFERALQRSPNRSLSLLGLARARAAAGERVAARRAYQRFLANWSGADASLPELREARAY